MQATVFYPLVPLPWFSDIVAGKYDDKDKIALPLTFAEKAPISFPLPENVPQYSPTPVILLDKLAKLEANTAELRKEMKTLKEQLEDQKRKVAEIMKDKKAKMIEIVKDKKSKVTETETGVVKDKETKKPCRRQKKHLRR